MLWKIRLSSCFGEVRRDQWEGGNIFVMNTKGLPQTPAPSSGMRRPSRNEEVLTHRQKQSWNVKSSLFPIKVSHALRPALAGCRDCFPLDIFWVGCRRQRALCEQWPKVLAYTMVSTGPPSIMQRTFLKHLLITCFMFPRCICLLMHFSFMMDNTSLFKALLWGWGFS